MDKATQLAVGLNHGLPSWYRRAYGNTINLSPELTSPRQISSPPSIRPGIERSWRGRSSIEVGPSSPTPNPRNGGGNSSGIRKSTGGNIGGGISGSGEFILHCHLWESLLITLSQSLLIKATLAPSVRPVHNLWTMRTMPSKSTSNPRMTKRTTQSPTAVVVIELRTFTACSCSSYDWLSFWRTFPVTVGRKMLILHMNSIFMTFSSSFRLDLTPTSSYFLSWLFHSIDETIFECYSCVSNTLHCFASSIGRQLP